MYHCELCAGVCLYFTEVQPDRVRQLTAFSACSCSFLSCSREVTEAVTKTTFVT